MDRSSHGPAWFHDHAEAGLQISHDPVGRLAQLWRTFEESGAISAYIAYRMHLAHLAYSERQHLAHWKSGHWQ